MSDKMPTSEIAFGLLYCCHKNKASPSKAIINGKNGSTKCKHVESHPTKLAEKSDNCRPSKIGRCWPIFLVRVSSA